MTFRDMISTSVGNLWRRKLRTFLTVLGVLIGTTSIVAMLSIALGMKQMIIDQYSQYGSMTQVTVSQDYSQDQGSNIDYMLSDTVLERISQIEHVDKVNPILSIDAQAKQGRYQVWATIFGVPEDEIKKQTLADGKIPETTSGNMLELLCGNVIPAQFADTSTDDWDYPYYSTGKLADVDLFSNSLKFTMNNEYADASTGNESVDESSTGTEAVAPEDTPSVDNSMIDLRAKVTGLMDGGVDNYVNSYSSVFATDIDSLKLYLQKNFKKGQIPGQPLDSNGRPFNEWIYSQFIVEVDDADNVDSVKQSIVDMGFSADSNKELIESTQKTAQVIELVLGSIGMIAFLVAAIGIANTMMMSTYERTKEIGVMKVLGCDMRDIMGMFLAEAGCIGFIGGTVGVLLTKGLSMIANKVLAGAIESSGIGSGNISIVPLWLMIVAIAFSTLMGIVAGFFPARRAMKLSPLAAIRNE